MLGSGHFEPNQESFLISSILKVFIAEHVAQENISIVCDFILYHARVRMTRETVKCSKLSPTNFGFHF